MLWDMTTKQWYDPKLGIPKVKEDGVQSLEVTITEPVLVTPEVVKPQPNKQHWRKK